MNLLVNETEMAYCDSCGNYVPVVEDEGSLVCGYEFAEYPELATVIGQSMSVVTVSLQSSKKKRKQEIMYQVQVHNRQTGEVIMESDVFSTMAEADEMLSRIGSGEGYYSIVYKLDAVWSDLVVAQRPGTPHHPLWGATHPLPLGATYRLGVVFCLGRTGIFL